MTIAAGPAVVVLGLQRDWAALLMAMEKPARKER
jgi:hypothetical protein